MVAQAEETATGQGLRQEPWLTTAEARATLEAVGIPERAFRRLLVRGDLVRQRNAIDRRVYQIARAEVERVLRDGVDGMRPPRRKGDA